MTISNRYLTFWLYGSNLSLSLSFTNILKGAQEDISRIRRVYTVYKGCFWGILPPLDTFYHCFQGRSASTWRICWKRRRRSMRWWRRRRGSWRTLLRSSAGFVKAQRPFNALSQVGTNKRVLNFDMKLQDLIYCFHIRRLRSVVLLWISLKVAQTRGCLHATHHEVRHSDFYIFPNSLFFFAQNWCNFRNENL